MREKPHPYSGCDEQALFQSTGAGARRLALPQRDGLELSCSLLKETSCLLAALWVDPLFTQTAQELYKSVNKPTGSSQAAGPTSHAQERLGRAYQQDPFISKVIYKVEARPF